ncbi:atrial natriuretic peptide-converting enzyme isoform X2 [Cimex lectularius]|uniref:Serine protease n=1 Tax=Cimex lectularius TaxID=79782 RepID=A0A8I6SRB5_CIMLE|nr:atrial natriuretic peptide-converting enzyme isoform X2 [Cimex lectularius]
MSGLGEFRPQVSNQSNNPFQPWLHPVAIHDSARNESGGKAPSQITSTVLHPQQQQSPPQQQIPTIKYVVTQPPRRYPISKVPPPVPARTRPCVTGRQRPPPPPRPHRTETPVIKEADIPPPPPPSYSELYPITNQTILRRYSHGQVPENRDDTLNKLPPPRPNPPNRKFSEGNLPADINYKFNHKRNTNVILPPPIQTEYEDIKVEPEIPERQDSNVSSDSFSQNSSPSYTTKSMEAPLLPQIAKGTGVRKKKYGSERGKDLGPIKIDRDETVPNDPNTSPITKSHSTPASLQTIVRFHNGSNMSLHHRIIRDMRRPSNHYITSGRLRFQFVQVIFNALAIMAIAGGVALYFKAYPPTVRYVNRTVTTTKNTFIPQQDINPAPGLCVPVIVKFCLQHGIPYNFTMFPNYIGHFNQREASPELEVYEAVVDVKCYELAPLFLCSVFIPKCGPDGRLVRPCKSLCFETKRRCGFFLEVFGLTLPDYLDCELFPESEDPDTCIGHKEVIVADLKQQRPVCSSGFQCDVKRCIPADWRCDGHVDCEDQSDELNCKDCAAGMIHCGANQCIAQSHMCDGEINCPKGQDERNCMRLSERMGDEGHGKLEIFQPDLQSWRPACVSNWADLSAKAICNFLGYADSNSSTLSLKGKEGFTPSRSSKVLDPSLMWRTKSRKKRMFLLKELRNCPRTEAYPTVDLSCTNIICGQRRQVLQPSTRIIGGKISSPGDWPFLAALLGGPEQIFYCAGVLISDQWVLTASHCVGNFSHGDTSGWTIQLGITRRHAHSYFGQKAKVKRVVPHPLYNIGIPHDNDVALFQLQQRVTFHEHLLPVCLPSEGEDLVPGTYCTVIGWGKREDTDLSEYEASVNEVKVPVLNRTVCNKWLEPRDLNVTQGMICAGYEAGGKDACQGDSGGPLLCPMPGNPDRWFVGGIVSWGIKCAHPRLPGVYAYVPRYVQWIRQQMALFSDL